MRFPHPLSLTDLLGIIKHPVTLKGQAIESITGINELHSVSKGDLTFADCEKYYNRVLSSNASVILMNKDVECPKDKTLILTEDPLQDYLQVVRHFTCFNPQTAAIHPDADLGEGTIIQPLVFIGEHVKIGKNCIIHSHVSIYDHTTIEDNVIIHSNSTIGGDACYFQRRPEGWLKLVSCGDTFIGNNVEIGCNCCVDKGVSGTTYIGDGCKFDNLVQVGHDTHIGARVLLGAQSAIAGCTYIDDDCILWAKASVNKDLYLAKHTTVYACSAVSKSISIEGTKVFGIPATDAKAKWKEIIHTRNLSALYDEVAELKKFMEGRK